jgi:hypothetical protein
MMDADPSVDIQAMVTNLQFNECFIRWEDGALTLSVVYRNAYPAYYFYYFY